MDNRFNSVLSLDSLDLESKKNLSPKNNVPEKMVDTILVPFYEKDILVKVSKGSKKKTSNKPPKIETNLGEPQQYNGYLINKTLQKGKKMSYLEIFRKQFSANINEKNTKNNSNEIRSISPEFGDTERESFGEEYNNNGLNDFYNTEAYNEIYYEHLINPEHEEYLEESFDDGLCFNDDIGIKNQDDIDDNNLRSISEVSRPRRHTRRATAPINENIKLGGLGPDVENIRPRLERAKSLQRYSEKVRMENRVRMYKKEMEVEKEKNAEKDNSAKHRRPSDMINNDQKGKKSSYLVDKTSQAKTSVEKKITKSADVKERDSKQNKPTKESVSSNEKDSKPNRVIERKLLSAKENLQKYMKSGYETARKKASARSLAMSAKQKQNSEMPPVEIRFTVNVGGVRPSSALKSLEEKHRIYQEKVKEFTMQPNKG